jgi:hypothetical protein
MNVTYIIGNGFDLNLGLKTSYHDFYNYYKNVPSPNDDIKDLKEDIKSNINQWSDLEYKIGQYTSVFPDSGKRRVINVQLDLAKNLKNYLKGVSEAMPITMGSGLVSLSDDLGNPDKHLTPVERNRLIEFYNSFNTSSSLVNIITLNYTSFIEDLLGFQIGNSLDLQPSGFNGRTVSINKILHLHEKLNGNILVGVNDENQIANEAFRTDQTLKEFLIKPIAIQMFGTGVDYECEHCINDTNLFVLFGVSLGDTDRMWWEKIANRLQQDRARMIIFHYDKNFEGGYFMGEEKRSVLRKFLDQTSLDQAWYDTLNDRIFIAPNTQMFYKIRQSITNPKGFTFSIKPNRTTKR